MLRPRQRRRRRLRTLGLLAAVLAVLAALGASGLAGQPEDYRVYATAQDGLLTYLARPREDLGSRRFHPITPGWLPEGYTLERQSQNGEEMVSVYASPGGEWVRLSQWCGREQSGVALGEYLVEEAAVHGCEGVYFAQADGGGVRFLLWAEGPYVLELTSEQLGRTELAEIAENLEW